MSKQDVMKVVKNVQSSIKRHGPEILTTFGIVGAGTTVVLAVKGTPKALQLIEEKKEEEGVNVLPPIEIIKVAWKPYIPAMVTGTLSVACLIGASTVGVRRQAALATAYSLTETAFREYKDKVIETIGEEKVQEVRDAIAKDKVEKEEISTQDFMVKEGDVLCYDMLSGRKFSSNANKIKEAVNNINERMLKWEYASLNDLYYELDLDITKLGNELGWNICQGMIDVDFSSQLTRDNKPCLVLDFNRMPIYDFDRWV